MSGWWWVPIGLAAWFAVSVPVGLVIGRWLRNGSRAREQAGAGFRQARDGSSDEKGGAS